MANLAIDIGNTRAKLALFEEEVLLQKQVWDELRLDDLRQMAYNQNVGKIILSSVARQSEEVMAWLRSHPTFVELGTDTPLPITNRYATPHTLGKDRIAAAVGAWHLYPGETCLVVDAGTCMTLDVVSAAGEFLGGNISPGVEMRLRAMHHFTARLPLVQHDGNWAGELGQSTEQAIRNGAELGAVLELEGFTRLCRRKFGKMKVVLTGGDTEFFVKHTKTKIFAHPNLVLLGLNQILKHNASISEGF